VRAAPRHLSWEITSKTCPDTRTDDIAWRSTAWKGNALIPAEQARVVRLLVARVTASEAGLAVDIRHEGLGAIAALMAPTKPEVA
jgi:site-specific DNA recombinase